MHSFLGGKARPGRQGRRRPVTKRSPSRGDHSGDPPRSHPGSTRPTRTARRGGAVNANLESWQSHRGLRRAP
jgi:hypothetical protein